MNYVLIIIGFIILIKCADFFVEGCSKLASYFKIPPLIIGLTIVAFGTSAPEASVSIISSIQKLNNISVGNVVGSNICNLFLVLGISSCFGILTIDKKTIIRDYSYMIFSSLILLIMISSSFIQEGNKAIINKFSGLILISLLFLYLGYLLLGMKKNKKPEKKEEFHIKYIIYIVLGLLGIILGGKLVVNNAKIIAYLWGVSDHLIGLTIIAIGTSLPEIVTSSIATYKGESDIAIGNVIGSNIFNILLILGIASTITPIIIDFISLIDIIIMVISTLIVLILFLKDKKLNYKKGIFLLTLYTIYMFYIINR